LACKKCALTLFIGSIICFEEGIEVEQEGRTEGRIEERIDIEIEGST
jgi:hypothetical protein